MRHPWKPPYSRFIDAEGRIDVLINNAGYGSYGAIEDVPIDEARRQFEVNLFGLARLTQLVLPHMRTGQRAHPEHLPQWRGVLPRPWVPGTRPPSTPSGVQRCTGMEVEEFGIDVVIIEPGGIKTPWGLIAADHLEESSRNGVYAAQAHAGCGNMRKFYSAPPPTSQSPRLPSNAILRALEARCPKTRYLVGFGAKPSVFLHTVLPGPSL